MTRPGGGRKNFPRPWRLIIGALLAALLIEGIAVLLLTRREHETLPGSPEKAVQLPPVKGVARKSAETAATPTTVPPVVEGGQTAASKTPPQATLPEGEAPVETTPAGTTPAETTPAETARPAEPAQPQPSVPAPPSGAATSEIPMLPPHEASGRPAPSSNCAGDSTLPWVYPDRGGGMYYGPIRVFLQVNKPCTVSWRLDPDTAWFPWNADTIIIDRTASLSFRAIDRCGRAMEPKTVSYEIRAARTNLPCPPDMEPVEGDGRAFCIDRYEWPGRKGAVPLAYVSHAQAIDSCESVGKRLCSSDEWSFACAGADSAPYPYGRTYERYLCVTNDTIPRPAGFRSGCRAYFGAYDMSGNLTEWTSTPSRVNPRFYNVMGGFWKSGPSSGCFDARYSYFPQNRHNPVGFRCCRDFAPAGK